MKRIPLTNSSKSALVDDHQHEKTLWTKWFLTKDGHVYSTCTPQVSLHDFLFGKVPRGFEWDHRNRDGLDNQRHNLRVATHQQNVQNRGMLRSNKSGYIGVFYRKRKGRKRWVAIIWIRGFQKWLGYFLSPIEAARAYDSVAFGHRGNFAVLNFPIKRYPRLRWPRLKHG